jgi:hypothetical protein
VPRVILSNFSSEFLYGSMSADIIAARKALVLRPSKAWVALAALYPADHPSTRQFAHLDLLMATPYCRVYRSRLIAQRGSRSQGRAA